MLDLRSGLWLGRETNADEPINICSNGISYSMGLQKRTIPANAALHDFRMRPRHEGLRQHSPDGASLHFEAEVYFNVAHEVVGTTVIVSAGSVYP